MSIFRSTSLPIAAIVITAVLACGTESAEPEVSPDEPAASTGTAPAASEQTTPGAGSTAAVETVVEADPEKAYLVDLVTDIREGVAPLAATVEESPDAARETAVRLYVTRQEVIEERWGPRAGVEGESSLADAVEEAEHRFHELMERLNATPPPDSTGVAGAVAALDAQLAEVLREAGDEGAR